MTAAALLVSAALVLGAAAASRAQDAPASRAAEPADDAARLAGLERDGAALACLYGVPTAAQIDRARELLADFAQHPTTSPAAAQRSQAHRLVRARLALIAAVAFADDPTAAAACVAAAELELAAARPEEPEPQTEKFLLLAAAELVRPAADSAAAGRAFDHLQDAKNILRANRAEGTPARTQLEMTCATTLAALIERGPDAALRTIDRERTEFPFIMNSGPDALGQILAADLTARALARRASDASEPATRRAAIDDLCAQYHSLAIRTDLGLDPTALRSLALAKAASLLRPGDDHALLPGIAAAALTTSAPRDDALRIGRAALARPGSADGWRTEIALALADRLMTPAASGQAPDPSAHAEACAVLLDAAQAMPPHDPRAGRTLALACAAAQTSGDRALLAQSLRASHESLADVPGRDAHRLVLAQLLTADPAQWPAALDVINAIRPPGEHVAQARRMGVALAAELARLDPTEASLDRFAEALTRAEADLGLSPAPAWLEAAAATLALARGDAVGARDRATAALVAAERSGDAPALLAAAEAATLASIRLDDAAALPPLLDRIARATDPSETCSRIAAAAWTTIEPHLRPFPADASPAPGCARTAAAFIALARWADESPALDVALRGALRLRAAHAAATSGDWTAAAAILADDPPAGADPADWRALRAEASLALGDDAGALRELEALGRALESDEPRADQMWRTKTRVVELLDRRNIEGLNNAAIRAELTALRAREDWGSCEPCAAKLEPLVGKYLPDPASRVDAPTPEG